MKSTPNTPEQAALLSELKTEYGPDFGDYVAWDAVDELAAQFGEMLATEVEGTIIARARKRNPEFFEKNEAMIRELAKASAGR